VNYSGSIFHYNGTSWSRIMGTISIPALNSIWGTSASDVWAVGDGTNYSAPFAILHYDGATWSSAPTPTTFPPVNLSAVCGTSASDVWAVGIETVSAQVLHSILLHVTDAASSGAIIIHYNGTTWPSVSSGTTPPIHLSAVWGSSASDVWAVGVQNDYGKFLHSIILHYNGTAWSPVWRGTTGALSGVWGTSASDVWAVGDNGTILQYSGGPCWSPYSGTT